MQTEKGIILAEFNSALGTKKLREQLVDYVLGNNDGRKKTFDSVSPIDQGYAEKPIAITVWAELGGARSSTLASALKGELQIKWMYEHIRFEHWRRAQDPTAYQYAVFSDFVATLVLVDPTTMPPTDAQRASAIKEWRELQQPLAGTPMRVHKIGGQGVENTTLGQFLQDEYPEVENNQASEAEYLDAIAVIDAVLTWMRSPASVLEMDTSGEPAAPSTGPAPVAPSNPSNESTTQSSSTTTTTTPKTTPVVTPPPRQPEPPAPQQKQAEPGISKSEYERVVEENGELRAQIKTLRVNTAKNTETINKMVANEQELHDTITRLETDLDNQAKTHKSAIDELQRKQEDFRRDIATRTTDQQVSLMMQTQEARIKSLQDIQVIGIQFDTKTGLMHDKVLGTLADYNDDGQPTIEALYDSASVDQLKAKYMAGGGLTKLGLYADHVEQAKLANLASGQLGSERILATFSDAEGRVTNTMELPRLAPRQTEDLRRYLIADLRNENQPVKQGLGRRDQIPREGRVSLQVYSRGGLVKSEAFRYGSAASLHAQSITESNGARLYTTGLSYITARPDMLIIPY